MISTGNGRFTSSEKHFPAIPNPMTEGERGNRAVVYNLKTKQF